MAGARRTTGTTAGTGSARARRVSLDRATIVEAALRLTASAPRDALSFRRLGAELGADPTAVYRHFRDKDELIRALIDRLTERMIEGVPEDLPWRERLRVSADIALELMVQHPAVAVEAGARNTGGPGERAAIEFVLAAFTEAGLDDDAVVRYYGVYTGYLLAFVSSVAAGRLFLQPRELETEWVSGLAPADPVRFPRITGLAAQLHALTDQDVFTTGVELILGSAEREGSTSPPRS